MKAQKGFGLVEIIIIIAIVGLLGVAGWLVYDRQKSPTTADSSAQTAQEPVAKPDPNAGYLVIKEWGVKIKMKDAAKVTYDYTSQVTDDDKGKPDSSITLKVKPEYMPDENCKVSVGWTRYTSISDERFLEITKKIGDYFFISGGSPYNCENEANNALNASVRADFGNLEAL